MYRKIRVLSSALMLWPAEREAELGPELRMIEVGLRREDDDPAPAKVDQRLDHPVDVLEIEGTAEIDEDVVRLVEAAGRVEAGLLGRDHERPAGLAEADQVCELGLPRSAPEAVPRASVIGRPDRRSSPR